MLLARLKKLAAQPWAAAWADRTAAPIRQLTAAQLPAASTVRGMFKVLRAASEQALRLADQAPDADGRTAVLQARFALIRRLDVWQAVLAAREGSVAGAAGRAKTNADPRQLGRLLAAVAARTDNGTPRGVAWREYLMLDTLQSLARPVEAIPAAKQRAIARRVLDRLANADLTDTRREFIGRRTLAALEDQLRYWATAPLDLRTVLVDIERYETTGTASAAHQVAKDRATLACSPRPELRELARRIRRHYGNANLRIAVASDLINRWLPRLNPRQEPVRDTIAGAAVTGQSRITTQLSVRMIPDPRHIRIGLEAHGTVLADTASRSGPATFLSTGQTTFAARKLVLISPASLQILPAMAEADSHMKLRKLKTTFDSLPLIGSLVRRVARSQHDMRRAEAIQEVEVKVARRARAQLDASADRRIKRLREQFNKHPRGPHEQTDAAAHEGLRLAVVPLDAHTTDRRLIARLRVANSQQLGAHTPRPQAPAGSLLSLQLHESAIQNLLDELDLDGRRFTAPELYRTVAKKLGWPDASVPEDLPARALVRFADHDAVRFRCVDGRVQITLAIAELSRGRDHYRNFRVVASYRPVLSGLHPRLVRDGIIHLAGKRFRTRSQIVLRGVFAKLLPRHRPVNLLPQQLAGDPRMAGLGVTQLIVQNGWIGLAIGPGRQSPLAAAGSAARH